ncbi:thioredoxin family protein [Nocardioides sp. SYSU DS0651]|uniref:thioredoxin family protein n=1 Tax=Nocardioides sp. SYSU DS0651 TaxID=3415955 RepID=UPI003F4C2949
MTVKEITDADWDRVVLGATEPVLVEWWAAWCPPCKQVAPVLERIAEERAGALRVVKINQDENPLRASEHRVLGLPTMVLYRGGEPVLQLAGARSKAALERDIDQALGA